MISSDYSKVMTLVLIDDKNPLFFRMMLHGGGGDVCPIAHEM